LFPTVSNSVEDGLNVMVPDLGSCPASNHVPVTVRVDIYLFYHI